MKVPCWTVRWWARTGEFSCDERREIAIFTEEKEAEDLKEQLEAAFRLIRQTHHTRVDLTQEP